jgi:hypothetical protein
VGVGGGGNVLIGTRLVCCVVCVCCGWLLQSFFTIKQKIISGLQKIQNVSITSVTFFLSDKQKKQKKHRMPVKKVSTI